MYDHYTIDEYAERLEVVHEALGTKQFHLYGQSWGGRLALKYVPSYPDNVAPVTLADASVDIQRGAETM